MLCERGIRTFESHTRFTLPLATVVYLHGKTHLPVVVDPSHGTGHTWLVPQMCAASVAAGADGLIIEVHPDPEHALSDGGQSMNLEQFADTMRSLPPRGRGAGTETRQWELALNGFSELGQTSCAAQLNFLPSSSSMICRILSGT